MARGGWRGAGGGGQLATGMTGSQILPRPLHTVTWRFARYIRYMRHIRHIPLHTLPTRSQIYLDRRDLLISAFPDMWWTLLEQAL